MKRCTLLILLFLVLGAALNVAIAWACVYFAVWYGPLSQDNSPASTPATSWPVAAPPSWPAPVRYAQRITPGWTGTRYLSALPRPISEWKPGDELFSVDVHAVGWPARSLQWHDWGRHFHTIELPEPSSWNEGLRPPPWFGRLPRVWKRLPLRPVPLGFAINTVLYTAALMLLGVGVQRIRRTLRLRAGLCPRCKYPIGSSPICTECGRAAQLPTSTASRPSK